MVVALLVAGCAPGDDTAVDLPSAYVYQGEVVEDVVDPVEMQVELQDLLDNIREFNGNQTMAAYGQARAYGDELCPLETVTETPEDGTTVYFDRLCVVDDRYWFKGPMTTYTFSDNTLDQFEIYDFAPQLHEIESTPWTGMAMKGQTDIFDSENTMDFNCSCTAVTAVSPPLGTEQRWFTYTDGPSHWIAPEAADSWINQGIQSHMWIAFWLDKTDGDFEAVLEGSVTGYGSEYGSIDLDMTVDGTRGDDGVTCAPGTGGTAQLRHTTTGVRTDMTLVTDDSCDACGDVAGTTLCVDLTHLADWDSAPW
jgi:hypothetical protein